MTELEKEIFLSSRKAQIDITDRLRNSRNEYIANKKIEKEARRKKRYERGGSIRESGTNAPRLTANNVAPVIVGSYEWFERELEIFDNCPKNRKKKQEALSKKVSIQNQWRDLVDGLDIDLDSGEKTELIDWLIITQGARFI